MTEAYADACSTGRFIIASKRAGTVAIGGEADSSGRWSVRSE
jgi:hypothetical protein